MQTLYNLLCMSALAEIGHCCCYLLAPCPAAKNSTNYILATNLVLHLRSLMVEHLLLMTVRHLFSLIVSHCRSYLVSYWVEHCCSLTTLQEVTVSLRHTRSL